MILPDVVAEKTSEGLEESPGTLSFQNLEDKLMHSVLEADKDTVEDAQLLDQSLQASGSFHPDLMMEKLVQNYSLAKELYGETMLRLLSSYNPGYIEKNINIPEFQQEMLKKIQQKIEEMKKKGFLTSEGKVNKRGKELVTLHLLVKELDTLIPKGFEGRRVHKKVHMGGDKEDIRIYKKGDRFADLDIRTSIKTAIRRGHEGIQKRDLRIFERKSKGSVSLIYGLDASGSMKGKKLAAAKKAGMALSYRAITQKDKVGLAVFETIVKDSMEPTLDFPALLRRISDVNATKQTDIAAVIKKSIDLFDEAETKHLILLTDALPTVGSNPETKTMEAVYEAVEAGIIISIIGLGIDKKGANLAKQITSLGKGRFHQVKDLNSVDTLILEEYYDHY